MAATATKKATKKKATRTTKATNGHAKQEELLKRIMAAETRVSKCAIELLQAEQDVRDAKELAKGKKASHLHAVRELQAEIKGDATRPLLNAMEGREPIKAAPVEATTLDESWRVVTLQSLDGLTEAIVLHLHAADLHTVGELADYTAGRKVGKHGPRDQGRRLTDLKGIGPAAAETIENAMTAFWAKQKTKPASSETKPTVDETKSASAETKAE
jgi:hypothetical protein